MKRIENTVCTVEKTLHLWNEPIMIEIPVCVCVSERERERVFVVCVRESERESVCVWQAVLAFNL